MPFTVRRDGVVVSEINPRPKSPLCMKSTEEVKARVALEAARSAIDALTEALEEFWTSEGKEEDKK